MATSRILFVAALAACSGDVDGDGPGGEGGPLTPPDCTVRGPRMIRRLTARQLRITLERAFNDQNVPTADVVADPVVLGFAVDATQAVIRDLDAQLVMQYAESVADWAVANKLGALTACRSTDAACLHTLVESLGKKLFREPLAADDADAYVELAAAEATFEDAARVAIAALIQSPRFLYRRELGERRDDGLYALTPYELASSLSYMITSGPPDDALLAAAADGRLATRADLDREAQRLLGGPEAEATFGYFARNWLQVDDLPTRAKLDPNNQFGDSIRRAMLDETTKLFMHVLRNGKLGELFTAPYTFVDGQLAGFYGLPGSGQVTLPPNTRAPGVLGHGSMLARHALADVSSPTQRGVTVRRRLLCEEIAPPPPNVDTNLPPPMGMLTTRQRYEAHAAAGACRGCHARLDPVGFAFERFDALGRRRDTDNGLPIDTHGELTGMSDGDIPLADLDGLAAYLGTSADARACLVRYLSYFGNGLDQCSRDEIASELAAGDGSLKSALLAIIHAPHFTTRTGD
jgi:hypothetical protein